MLGNRGLGTIRRTILGSVCDYVTQHMNVPVLMVPSAKKNNNNSNNNNNNTDVMPNKSQRCN